MKQLLHFSLLFCIANVFAQINNPAPYCATGYKFNYNMMTSMNFNGTNFNGFGPTGSWSSTTPYRYFNTTTLNPVTQGQTFNLSIVFPSVNDAEPRYFAVWIDFNKNNQFEASELVMQNSNTNNNELPVFGAPAVTVNRTIQVPADAVAGVTRMRIRRGQNDGNVYAPYSAAVVLSPCAGFDQWGNQAFGYNSTADFNVTIQQNLSTEDIKNNAAGKNKLQVVDLKGNNYQIKVSQGRILSVSVFDMTGKKTDDFKMDSGKTDPVISLNHLPKGLYMVRVDTTDGVLSTKLILR